MTEQRIWQAPKTGLMYLRDVIDKNRQRFIEQLAKDAGVPEGTDVTFDGTSFATICHNEGDQNETEDV